MSNTWHNLDLFIKNTELYLTDARSLNSVTQPYKWDMQVIKMFESFFKGTDSEYNGPVQNWSYLLTSDPESYQSLWNIGLSVLMVPTSHVTEPRIPLDKMALGMPAVFVTLPYQAWKTKGTLVPETHSCSLSHDQVLSLFYMPDLARHWAVQFAGGKCSLGTIAPTLVKRQM